MPNTGVTSRVVFPEVLLSMPVAVHHRKRHARAPPGGRGPLPQTDTLLDRNQPITAVRPACPHYIINDTGLYRYVETGADRPMCRKRAGDSASSFRKYCRIFSAYRKSDSIIWRERGLAAFYSDFRARSIRLHRERAPSKVTISLLKQVVGQ